MHGRMKKLRELFRPDWPRPGAKTLPKSDQNSYVELAEGKPRLSLAIASSLGLRHLRSIQRYMCGK